MKQACITYTIRYSIVEMVEDGTTIEELTRVEQDAVRWLVAQAKVDAGNENVEADVEVAWL